MVPSSLVLHQAQRHHSSSVKPRNSRNHYTSCVLVMLYVVDSMAWRGPKSLSAGWRAIILSWTVSSSFVLYLAPRLHSGSINHPNKLTPIFHCAHGFVFTRLVDCVDGLCLIWMVCAAPNPDCLKFAKWNRWSANRICSSNHIQTWMNLIRISCCFCYCIDVKIEVGTDSIYWDTSIRECAIYHENIALVCLDWVRHSLRFNHELKCLNEFSGWLDTVSGGVRMTEMH